MQDQLLEGAAALRDDEQADGRPTGDEGLLDRTAAGDELLVRPKILGRRQGDGAWRAAAASIERWAIERLRSRAVPGAWTRAVPRPWAWAISI